MYKTIATTVSLFALSLSIGASSVFAGTCTNQYGATIDCQPDNLTVNKQVQDPISGAFVENITSARFVNGNNVIFRLTISNSSGETFSDVKVEDKLPDNLDYVDSDPTGTWDKTNKTVTITIGQMPADTKKTVFVWAKVVGSYPAEDPFCRDNWAKVWATARPNGSTDTARICITNKVLGTTSLPTAGVNDVVMMIPLLAMAGTGVALMRKK
jgi:uncharacterized repeat protein (TIGR01451 family)